MDFSIKTNNIINRYSTNSVKQQNVSFFGNSKIQPLEADTCEFSRDDAVDLLRKRKKIDDSSFKSRYEEVIQRSNGQYSQKTAEIIAELISDNGCMQGFARTIIENLNIENTDKDSLIELKNIFLKYRDCIPADKMLLFWQSALEKDGSFTEKSIDDIKKLISKYPMTFNNDAFFDFSTAAMLRHYKNIKSIDELSMPEKNEFLTRLYSCGFNEKVYKDFDILPKNKEEYKKLIDDLIKQTSVDVQPLLQDEILSAISTFENLPQMTDTEISAFIQKLYPEIGKPVAETISVLKRIIKDKRFTQLPQNDKLTIQLAVILKDSSKMHGVKNVEQSAFNAFYLAEKLNLSHENKLKLYAIIKNQNILNDSEKGLTTMSLIDRSVCELRHENSVAMLDMLNDAYGVKTKTQNLVLDKLHKPYMGLKGNSKYQIKQTNLPKASQFIVNGDSVQKIKKDGIKNTVVYLDRKTPIKYKDQNNVVKELLPKDVYNYCHSTLDLQGVELATRPNSNYAMSSSFVNPTIGTHHLFGTEGIITRVPKGNTYYEEKIAGEDGTGFGKVGDARLLKRIHEEGHDVSDICAKHQDQELSELRETNPNGENEVRTALNSMLSDKMYGENIALHTEPIGVFFEGPYKDYYFRNKMPETGKYEFKDVPLDHRAYARDKDFAVFYLGR